MITKFQKNRKKNSVKSIFFSIFFGVLILSIIGLLVITNLKISQRRTKLTAQIETLKKEIQILEEKNKEIKEEILKAGGEEYLEKVARDQLGLKKPGEDVIVIQKEEEEKTEIEEERKSWWEWLKGIFNR